MKVKKHIILSSSLLFLTILSFGNSSVNAEVNPQVIQYSEGTRKVEFDNGSIYYPTSNIREWLNSNSTTVQYTNDPPPYADEAGFLNGFTSGEYEAIAISERRVNIHSVFGTKGRDGGLGDIAAYSPIKASELLNVGVPGIHEIWDDLYYQKVKEKVFMLSAHELAQYVQVRGENLKKELTIAEMKRLNRSNPYYSYFTSTYRHSTSANGMYIISAEGVPSNGGVRSSNGIIPSLHIKPNYVFADGRIAGNLKIGDQVIFGSYNQQPIEWEVINVSNGYPLLWSDKILTVRIFDEKGEKILRNSESLLYDTVDVSIADDLHYINHQGSSDKNAPAIRVANEVDMFTLRNDKFTLFIEALELNATDSGIDYILLPDGRKDYRSFVDYEITENGYYEFVAVDKAGNQQGIQVPIGNISPPASVLITSSASNWTNQDVTVDITTSLNKNTSWSVPSYIGSGSMSGPRFSEYTSHMGKSFRVTGDFKIVKMTGLYPQNTYVNFYINYNYMKKVNGVYFVGAVTPPFYSLPFTQLSTEEFTSVDRIITLSTPQSNVSYPYFNGAYPQFIVHKSKYGDDGHYEIEARNVKFELLNDEELYIEKILLPDGTEVEQNNYREVLTKSGDYTYKVLDSRGKVTEKTISIKIDKTQPSAHHNLLPNEFTNQDVAISVTGIDSLSGVKRIKKPNGEWVNGENVTYYVNQNGTYTFTIEDHAGNLFNYPVSVMTIDKQKPSISFTPTSRDWDTTDISVGITLQDSGTSGVKEYRYAWSESQTKPTSGWSGWYLDRNGVVTTGKNGMFYLHVEAIDHAGNETYVSSGVYKMLKHNENPMIGLSLFPKPGNWMNHFIEVSISENLDYSNDLYVEKKYEITSSPIFPSVIPNDLPLNRKILVSKNGANYIHIQYTLSNGTRIKYSEGPYLIDTNSIGSFITKIIDTSGKEVTDWTNQPIFLSISDPAQTSVSKYTKQYRIENLDHDWQPYEERVAIVPEGEYRIFTRIVNEAGMASNQQVVTVKLDTSIPNIQELSLKKDAAGQFTVNVKANDTLSKIEGIDVLLSDNTKKKMTSTNGFYNLYPLDKLPKSLVITDHAGNRTSEISFAKLPTITFATPYDPTLATYRGNVTATISEGVQLTYQIGNKKYDCSAFSCEVTMDRNTTLTATNTEGNKTSSHSLNIHNIDKSPLSLILEGKRAENKILFEWNYSISNGTLICYRYNEKIEFANMVGKSGAINATNALYDCSLKGLYGGELIESNRVVLSSLSTNPIDDTIKKENVNNLYVEESRAGESYFINTKRNNTKDNYVSLPSGLFE